MQKIFLIAILISLIFFCLYFLEKNPNQTTEISEITSRHVGSIVKVSGNIVRINSSQNMFFLTIENKGRITVLVSRSFLLNRRLSINELKVGRKIFVEGVVTQYRNRLQIVPTKLDLL